MFVAPVIARHFPQLLISSALTCLDDASIKCQESRLCERSKAIS
jgi:hypothetical protein